MHDINIKRDNSASTYRHCGKCGRLINAICATGINAFSNTHESPCFFYADDISKYLLQCIAEAYREKLKVYIKPSIISDGKWDHYNKKITGDYCMSDIIVSGDTDILLISGEAGIGKSTFMNELYLSVAEFSLKNSCEILPIYLKADTFGNDDCSPETWVNNFLSNKYRFLDMTPAFFHPGVQIVLFIDAINDIQYVDYDDFQNKLDMWRSYIEDSFGKYSRIKFVISSRYLDCLSDFELRNYTRFYLQPWDDDQVNEYLSKMSVSPAKRNEIIKLLRETGENNCEIPFLRLPFFLDKIIDSPIKTIKNKTDVIDTFVEALLQKCDSNRYLRTKKVRLQFCGKTCKDIRLNGTTLLSVLSEIAYKKSDITDKLIQQLLGGESEHFINLVINSSILISKSKGRYVFTHNILEEYFTARYIAAHQHDLFDDISSYTEDITEVRTRQALQHVYNFIVDKNSLIKELIKHGNYVAAAECVLEADDAEIIKYVANEIIVFLNQSKRITDNISIGLLLGRLGDFRLTREPLNELHFLEPKVEYVSSVGLYVGVYPITNCEYSLFIKDCGYTTPAYWNGISRNWFVYEGKIRAICDFWINIQNKLNLSQENFYGFCKKSGFDKELIAHLVYFKAIPKEEIQMIVRDLYSIDKECEPLMWRNPIYNNPSQPVIGVSIYEAFAYCEWLSKKTNKTYRLLTNEEWESIAYANQKKYVYGNNYNEMYSNSLESRIKRIIPVGICSENRTRDGIYDLTGNIFEWTSSIYNNDSENKNELYVQYICKGGSWIQDYSRAQSSYVGRGMGWVRNLDLGFRVCLDEDR